MKKKAAIEAIAEVLSKFMYNRNLDDATILDVDAYKSCSKFAKQVLSLPEVKEYFKEGK